MVAVLSLSTIDLRLRPVHPTPPCPSPGTTTPIQVVRWARQSIHWSLVSSVDGRSAACDDHYYYTREVSQLTPFHGTSYIGTRPDQDRASHVWSDPPSAVKVTPSHVVGRSTSSVECVYVIRSGEEALSKRCVDVMSRRGSTHSRRMRVVNGTDVLPWQRASTSGGAPRRWYIALLWSRASHDAGRFADHAQPGRTAETDRLQWYGRWLQLSHAHGQFWLRM